ncbi:MAG TPA: electron transport complex protein RnfA [Candidatus Brocadiia bacterium]|nr:RnfABCDGE type electron transport complex subunit A [Candidatus Brocadiales bacterium]
MGEIGNILLIIVSVVFVNNFVLAKFLGLCPFVGVTQKTESALGMGMAVTFVMAMTGAVTWLVYNYILLPGSSNIIGMIFPSIRESGLVGVLKTASYILVIATLVQIVELALRKLSPALYESLGIYLPLITTNCAVLGVALLNTTDSPERLSFLHATVQGFGAGLGFMVAMLLMSGIRERLALANVPTCLQGLPIAFICTGLMALAFLGFSGMI